MNTKKKKRIVSITVTLILTAIFSIGAFAWFSISNQADVTNLALSAGTLGSLKIANDTSAPDADEAYSSSILFGMENVVLNPVTTEDGINFKAPIYSGNVVTDLRDVSSSTAEYKSYVYEKKCVLLVEEADDATEGKYNICLTASNGGAGTQISSTSGAVNSIRISFTYADEAGNPQTVVYEPASDGSNEGETAVQSESVDEFETKEVALKQYVSGSFDSQNASVNSAPLFQINSNEPLPVTIRIWIEGKDQDCSNAIQMDNVIGKIQFISEKVYN